jgi:hypothetical protein
MFFLQKKLSYLINKLIKHQNFVEYYKLLKGFSILANQTTFLMKKIILTTLMVLAIVSCTPPQTGEINGLTGVWNRIGTVNYENGKPKDTVPMNAKSKQVKFYSAEHFMFISNGEWMDSLGVDQFIGFGGNGSYEFKNDSLFEYMSHGTDNYLKWIATGNKIFTAKISLSKDHFTQYGLDSLGKGQGELYERME